MHRLDRRGFLVAAGAALLAGGPAQAASGSSISRIFGEAFGTSWSVSAPADADLPALEKPLALLLGKLDRAFSPWRADSALSRFNAAGARPFAVTDEVAGLVRSALAIAEASEGHFDPTVGPLVARWGFGPIHDGALPAGGWRGVEAGDGRLVKAEPGLTLDLCGIAKGHALDRMVELVAASGLADFVIDFGGEVAAQGRHPAGRAWQVGIEDPRPDAEDLLAVLKLDGLAVATSGDRANGYDFGGRRYSHIIDPATREPVAGALASVSVLMPRAREADGWATALMAAGPGGPALATRNGIAALFVFRDSRGLRRVATGAFERHLA